ncbi:SphA family protein [Pseudoduganella namucuonensis]|uniref:Uncharacterized conserved protein n=1 Tax=Pseudoduganella namucuonensis TaxID=1035707 RepID=A0A1I7L7K9_9BURK|nr:transporter [Pseudoduganella namucuonensis]SFV05618.1 Uncharacterized conserved protein [Pseudoduganella namucuonensis]
MNIQKSTTAALTLLCAALLGVAAPARATEGGAPITPFGVTDFGAGIMPPPSDVATVGVRTTFYHANQLRDDAGNRSPVGADLSIYSLGVAVIKMTKTTFLGATYGYAAVFPLLDMKLDLSIPTPAGPLAMTGRKTAMGDISVTPVILQWTSPGFFQYAALQVQAPTGSYDKNRLANPGTGHWTWSPTYAFTRIGQTGFEVSSTIQVNLNTRNHHTGYRSGAEWQQEFALGQHVGPYTVGLGGYFYHQFTDDRAAGLANGNRARVLALGPAINFFSPGSKLPIVWLHAFKEFGARNRSQGTQVALRAAFTF